MTGFHGLCLCRICGNPNASILIPINDNSCDLLNKVNKYLPFKIITTEATRSTSCLCCEECVNIICTWDTFYKRCENVELQLHDFYDAERQQERTGPNNSSNANNTVESSAENRMYTSENADDNIDENREICKLQPTSAAPKSRKRNIIYCVFCEFTTLALNQLNEHLIDKHCKEVEQQLQEFVVAEHQKERLEVNNISKRIDENESGDENQVPKFKNEVDNMHDKADNSELQPSAPPKTSHNVIYCTFCDFTTLSLNQLNEHLVDEHCKEVEQQLQEIYVAEHQGERLEVKHSPNAIDEVESCDESQVHNSENDELDNMDENLEKNNLQQPFAAPKARKRIFKSINAIYCVFCDFTTSALSQLNEHLINEHCKEVEQQLQEFEVAENQEEEFQAHNSSSEVDEVESGNESQVHKSEKEELENIDENEENSDSQLTSTASRRRKRVFEKSNVIYCIFCEFITSTLDQLNEHLNHEHNKEVQQLQNFDVAERQQERSDAIHKDESGDENQQHKSDKDDLENSDENQENSNSQPTSAASNKRRRTGYYCAFCEFTTLMLNQLNEHLNKEHCKEMQQFQEVDLAENQKIRFEANNNSSEIDVVGSDDENQEHESENDEFENIDESQEDSYSQPTTAASKRRKRNVYYCTICDFASSMSNQLNEHLVNEHCKKVEQKSQDFDVTDNQVNSLTENDQGESGDEVAQKSGEDDFDNIDENQKNCELQPTSAAPNTRKRIFKSRNAPYCTFCDFATSLPNKLKEHLIKEHCRDVELQLQELDVPENQEEVNRSSSVNDESDDENQAHKSQKDKFENNDKNQGNCKSQLKSAAPKTRKRFFKSRNLNKCNFCEFTTSKPNKLTEHLINEHCDSIFCCSLCNLHLPRTDLMSHMSEHAKALTADKEEFATTPKPTTTIEPKSKDCSRSSKNVNKVKRKSKARKGRANSFKCTICDKIFNTKRVMENHIRGVHSRGRRDYKCDICGKAFKIDSTLYAHLVLHTDVKPYKCKQCGSCFRRKQHLKTHMVQHKTFTKDELPFECKCCHKRFAGADNLRKHIKIHDPTLSDFVCHICGAKMKQKRYLRQHLRMVHLQKLTGR